MTIIIIIIIIIFVSVNHSLYFQISVMEKYSCYFSKYILFGCKYSFFTVITIKFFRSEK